MYWHKPCYNFIFLLFIALVYGAGFLIASTCHSLLFYYERVFRIAGSRRLLRRAVGCEGQVWGRNALCMWKVQWMLSSYSALLLWSWPTAVSLAPITSLTLTPPDVHPAKLRGTSQAGCVCDKFVLQYYRLEWFWNLCYLCNIYDFTKKW
jgi:hypothetical protein